jgi:predicted HAD superfamily phosphohydrolase
MSKTVKIYLEKLELFQKEDTDELLEELDELWLSMTPEELDYIEEELKLKDE